MRMNSSIEPTAKLISELKKDIQELDDHLNYTEINNTGFLQKNLERKVLLTMVDLLHLASELKIDVAEIASGKTLTNASG